MTKKEINATARVNVAALYQLMWMAAEALPGQSKQAVRSAACLMIRKQPGYMDFRQFEKPEKRRIPTCPFRHIKKNAKIEQKLAEQILQQVVAIVDDVEQRLPFIGMTQKEAFRRELRILHPHRGVRTFIVSKSYVKPEIRKVKKQGTQGTEA